MCISGFVKATLQNKRSKAMKDAMKIFMFVR